MRIVNFHPRARVGDGGITNSVRRLSEAFAEAGADPVIAYDGVGRPHREDGVQWWPVRHLGARQLRWPVDLAPALRGADVLVLNSAWSGANVVASAVARRTRTPYVLAPRGAYDPLIVARRKAVKRLWWRLFEHRMVSSASAVHVFFEDQRADFDALGYRGEVIVAPNGVRVPPDRSWDGGTGGYVVYLGRFDPEHKGLDLLLQAVALLAPDQRPDLRLHGPDWVGGKAKVVALVDRLGLEGQVTVGDAVYGEEKWDLLVRASGLVYPSRWEGFGNSLAEAAALGIPSLATPYPLAEFLAARDACLVGRSNPSELAAGLVALQGPQAAAMGDRARQVVVDELGWDAVARSWLEQLEQFVARETR